MKRRLPFDPDRQGCSIFKALEQSPVSVVITDRAGLIEYVNPRFTLVTGYCAQEAIGQNPRIMQSGQTSRETYQKLWQTISDGRIWQGIFLNRRKDGKLFWEEASISPIFDERSKITHFVAVKEDITERMLSQQQLAENQAHLEKLVQLRTPLNVVIGLSSLARSVSNDAKQRDYLDNIGTAGVTLKGIVNDLLDLSKISAARLKFNSVAFSLRESLCQCKSTLAFMAGKKGLKFSLHIDEHTPDNLIGDPQRLEQNLFNLLGNVIKYTKGGMIEVRVSTFSREKERICLKIDVAGLSPEDIECVFRPCKHLTEIMDGDLSVIRHSDSDSSFGVKAWFGIAGAQSPLPDSSQSPPQTMRFDEIKQC